VCEKRRQEVLGLTMTAIGGFPSPFLAPTRAGDPLLSLLKKPWEIERRVVGPLQASHSVDLIRMGQARKTIGIHRIPVVWDRALHVVLRPKGAPPS
jgi:hypothetical protein